MYSVERRTNLHHGTANTYEANNQAVAPVNELWPIWRTTSLCRGMNEKGLSLWKEKKHTLGSTTMKEKVKAAACICGWWYDMRKPYYFPWYKRTATQKYSWPILNQKQVARRLHICENNPAAHFHYKRIFSMFTFDVEADFNQLVYSSLGHRGFSISSWILLHKVFFVYWKVGELAPCEPVKFIKPARTKLFWLLLRK